MKDYLGAKFQKPKHQRKLKGNLEKVRKWKGVFHSQCLLCRFMLLHIFACFCWLGNFTLCTTLCFVY
ncbi:hypothetical protein PRUPE_2G204800 [Prunus persica]|uniref:Uncharacterized protein n=1 Tax=Prunus persica TaxID=3760 RepID=M5X1Q6_PRUPE|nr:hypothetical protein PRUPE_2G204800 [Prunus persica]